MKYRWRSNGGALIGFVHQRPGCVDEVSWELGVLVQRSGVRQLRGRCARCGLVSTTNAPHSLYLGSLDELPVFRDSRDGTACERCGSLDGVERHHWAPVHLFGIDEAWLWPVSMLCVECHREWHAIVTPNMTVMSTDGLEQ